MVKLFLSIIFVSATCSAATVSCSAPAVAESQSISCTASSAVTWSLIGVGSLSNASSTAVTYTAPASVTPQNVMGACQVMPNDVIYNTRIDALPLNANSSNYVTNVGGAGINFIPSWGISLANASTPTGTVKQYYGSNIVSNSFVLPATPALKRENGAFRSHFDGNDHHQLAVRTNDCTFWEIYNGAVPGDIQSTCQDGTNGCNAASAIDYPWSNYSILGGTDAAGLPLAALSLHLSEVKAGAVNHALRFTSCAGCIQAGTPLWPAVGNGGCAGINLNGNPCSYSPPYGARFRLRLCNGSSITTNCVTLSNYSTYAQTILTGLNRYGMFLADIGAEQQITPASDVTSDPAVMAALGSITGIPITYFDVVDETSLFYQNGNIQVCPYTSTTCGPNGNQTNSYEQPNNQAILVATPTGGGTAISTSIPIQGVAVGLNANDLFVVAGTYSFQIPSWVNGTSNQNVNWTLVNGVGSVTSSGIYTPPSSTSGGTTATLQVTSAADPNATAFVYLNILATSANPAGSVRIDAGGGGMRDGNGNVWLADQAYETGASTLTGGDYPSWFNDNASANPEIAIYESVHYTYGGDLMYNLMVPNGNYKVRLMMGSSYSGQPYFATTFAHQYSGRLDLEAQGQIAAHNFDFGQNEPAGFTQIIGVPTDTYIPALVTNNNLEIAIRGIFFQSDYSLYGNCNSCFSPTVNGIQIIPDSTAPHWAIDTQQQTVITPGSVLQLYQVDWYTGLSDVQWSILSGPGSISSAGLYTAPSMQPSAGTAVQILAQSASNPSINATVTLFLSGSGVDIK